MLTSRIVSHCHIVVHVGECGRIELEIENKFRGWCKMKRKKNEGGMRLTAGLMNPTVLFPAAIRASLTAAMMDAMMGAEADVPPELTNLPPSAMTNGHLVD